MQSRDWGLPQCASHIPDRAVGGAVQATSVFAWSVLGRSLVLLLSQSASLLATVLLLESHAVDGDPWQRLLSAMGRHVSGLPMRLRWAECALPEVQKQGRQRRIAQALPRARSGHMRLPC